MMKSKRSTGDTADELQRAARAACAGDLVALEQIVAEAPQVVRARDEDGDTLLGLACRAATGDIAIPPVAGTREQHAAIDLLLGAGADPSAGTAAGWAPLHTAAMAGHLDLAVRLLAAGASREGHLYGCEGGSALSLALFYAKTETADVIATPAVPDNLRSNAALGRPLDRFVRGDRLTAEAATGVDFYRPLLLFPEWQRTNDRQELLDEALTWSARNDKVDSMAALVELGADVNGNPYRGTPLLWAIYADQVSAATWLLEHGADPNLRHDFGGAGHGVDAVAMHLAAQYESLHCLRLLLDWGADTAIADGANGATPLEWAQYVGAVAAEELLRG